MERYLLIATISSIVFYAIYYFFLKKESFHRFNRFYLLGAFMVSLLVPFIRFSVPGTASTANFSEFIAYIQLPEFTVFAQPNAPSLWNITNIFLSIYLLGVFVFFILFLIKLFKISLLIIQSKKQRKDSYIFVEYDENMAPFSFFNYIFINQDTYNKEDNEHIILHEQIHVQQHHSWDLIFMELVGIVLWFNPVILLYKRSLQVIHEYLADHRVLQHGIEQGAYLNLLLRQLTLQNEWMLGHHFNYLLTKNRFKMLKKHHYSKWAIAKVLLVLPFVALLLMLNCKKTPQENLTSEENNREQVLLVSDDGDVITFSDGTTLTILDKPSLVPEDAVIEWADEETGKTYQWVKNDPPLRKAEVMPEPVGGMETMYKFLQGNLKYPQSARDKGITGQIIIEFVVEKDGSINDVKVIKGVDPELDAEAVRVIKMMPKWNPGMQDGQPVRTFYQIPIRFSIN
ncbi:MAG: M56 family metallopeptidase [Lentimicrobiaceae bacterium]|nr:M56 family metallopeptidase [Lentimicrobiaceae bacterium]